MAWFQENNELVEWVNKQGFDSILNCVGDGHPGIWNLMNQFNPEGETRQVLDWFHLVENLYKVGGSLRRIAHGKQLLWQGKVDETLCLFSGLKKKAAYNFCTYLQNHRHRIVDYQHFHTEGICPKGYRFAYAIASGAVESTVKQIDRRLKISERTCPHLAQWKVENVPQVLRHRCVTLR